MMIMIMIDQRTLAKYSPPDFDIILLVCKKRGDGFYVRQKNGHYILWLIRQLRIMAQEDEKYAFPPVQSESRSGWRRNSGDAQLLSLRARP